MRKQRSGAGFTSAAAAAGGMEGGTDRTASPEGGAGACSGAGKHASHRPADFARGSGCATTIADSGGGMRTPVPVRADTGAGATPGKAVAVPGNGRAAVSSGEMKPVDQPRADGVASRQETRERVAVTRSSNGDTIPAWQREAHLQPLVGPKESLTALMRDFKGSDLQYAKARTFLIRLRGQQQQQQQDQLGDPAGEGSQAHSAAATQERCCKRESGGSAGFGRSSSTSSSSSTHASVISREKTCSSKDKSCSTKNQSCRSGGGDRALYDERLDFSDTEATQEAVQRRKEVSGGVTASSGNIQKEGEEYEEDDVLEEVQGGPCMRRVRRDGSCFYRAYMFGLLIYFLRHRDKIPDFIKRINEEFRREIRKAGYDMDTVADFSQEMIESLEQIEAAASRDPVSEDIVEEIFNEVSSSNYIVVFARLLVSTHMKLNSELYLPFLTSHATVEEFCKHEVDPMWVAAEELQINALTAMTQVPVEIIYFDRSPGLNPTHHVFPESQKPQIHLLYRPGHYDILST